MNIIETENLSKHFGDVKAVDKVSMLVKQGEVYGFLGLNGAGKTTAIRLLLGLIKPNNGNCLLFGQKPKKATAIWNDIGYLIETPFAYPDLSVKENLQVICKLRNLKDSKAIDRIIDQLQLSRYKDTKEKNLSLGNKQRLGLAKALIHQPKLLILDEPINGLDPAGIVEIRMLLKDLAENHGTTIFLSSHILAEIARLTSRIGIIHNGSLIKELQPNDLQHQIIRKLQVSSNDNENALKILQENGYPAKMNHKHIEIADKHAIEAPERIATLLVQNQVPPKMISLFEEDLESFFLRMIKETTS